MNAERRTLLAAGAVAGFFAAGYLLAHVQRYFFQAAGWVLCGGAFLTVFFVVWIFLRSVIWKTEKRLFVRSVQDFGPEPETQTEIFKDSSRVKSPAE